ncbi:MAG: hypothetical protein AAB346_06670 [Pseudomonadota bacterium]
MNEDDDRSKYRENAEDAATRFNMAVRNLHGPQQKAAILYLFECIEGSLETDELEAALAAARKTFDKKA